MGLVSLFNDMASEMIYPIVPIFLTTVLGAPLSIVGLIEGIAEATASIFKVVSGWLSDKFQKRKIFVSLGYSVSTISKVIIGLAHSWPLVLVGRFIDRFGKGVRTSPRDALIAESTQTGVRGRSFGLHRALDTAGAVFGPLLALLFIYLLKNNLRPIFFIAFIPGVIGVIILILKVQEIRKEKTGEEKAKLKWRDLDKPFKVFLLISVIFALGNSSDAFLILRAKNLGLTISLTILAYVLYNFTYAAFSLPAGIASDKAGPKKVLFYGFLLFSLVYLGFALVNHSFWLWLLFPVYGIYMAMTDGVGKAYISKLISPEKLGTAFGIYQTAIGLSAFFASFVAGLLWQYVSISAPFIYASAASLLAAFLFIGLLRNRGASYNSNVGK